MEVMTTQERERDYQDFEDWLKKMELPDVTVLDADLKILHNKPITWTVICFNIQGHITERRNDGKDILA